MPKLFINSLVIFLVLATKLTAQESEIDLLIKGELKMTFPSIYFKNNSIDYAEMPYSVDSCFKHIAAEIKDIKSFVIWRDSSELENLTNKRIKKIKLELNNYPATRDIYIESMGKMQKISQLTIAKGIRSKHTQYLLSLNSVFDISKTEDLSKNKWKKKSHKRHPRIWCLRCWKRGAFFGK